MKPLSIAVVAAFASLPSAAYAGSIVIKQNHRANVAGVVQAGSQVGSVTITQSGVANVAGVIQATTVLPGTVNVRQTGLINSAFVGQMGTSNSVTIRQYRMP